MICDYISYNDKYYNLDNIYKCQYEAVHFYIFDINDVNKFGVRRCMQHCIPLQLTNGIRVNENEYEVFLVHES